MESTSSTNGKRNYSRYDQSGTDPNRYATVSNADEARSYLHKDKKSVVPGLRVNVSTAERIFMIAAGSYLLYRALKKSKKRGKKVKYAGAYAVTDNLHTDFANNAETSFNSAGNAGNEYSNDVAGNPANYDTNTAVNARRNKKHYKAQYAQADVHYTSGQDTATSRKYVDKIGKTLSNKHVLAGIAAGTLLFRGVTGYCPAYGALSSTKKKFKGSNVTIDTSLTVDASASDVYQAWRQLENLPLFMTHLHSVMVIDQYTSEWKARVPGGLGTISWKAEILMDEPNQLISWHSLPGSTIDNSGKVKFTDRGSSTDIEATISYHAPLGAAGEAAAKWLNPVFENIVKNDIANFKDYIEKKTKVSHI